MTDPQSLARRYASMSDDELREAAREGADAYRPEAWRVIVDEVARRGLRRVEPPAAPRTAVGASRRRARKEWTPGLAVALLPAAVLTVLVVRTLGPLAFGGRRGRQLLLPTFVFIILWFGIALVVDFVVERSARRRSEEPHR